MFVVPKPVRTCAAMARLIVHRHLILQECFFSIDLSIGCYNCTAYSYDGSTVAIGARAVTNVAVIGGSRVVDFRIHEKLFTLSSASSGSL